MQRRELLLTGGAVATILLAGCAGEGDTDDGEAEASADDGGGAENDADGEEIDPEEALEDEEIESTVDGLEILEHEIVEEDYSTRLQGVVVNNTGEEQSYVEVGAVLYNEDGQRIGDTFTNTTDLPDGEEWAFDLRLTEDADDIGDYSITVTDSAI